MEKIKKLTKYLTLIFGLTLVGISFNLFILPNNIVNGGVMGISVILKNIIDPSVFVFSANIILLIISLFTLGFEKTRDYTLGALLLPFFIKATSFIPTYVNISETDLILQIIFAATLSGTGIGIIAKNGFSTGGSDIIARIVSKYAKTSVGKSLLIVDSLIILTGIYQFGIIKAMYAVVFVYVVSIVIDKIMLGISENKAFYIMTKEEDKVKHFILEKLNRGASILSGAGGHKNDQKNIIFCVIPSNQYFRLKEGIEEIDKEAFFIVTDAYEVKGGSWKNLVSKDLFIY